MTATRTSVAATGETTPLDRYDAACAADGWLTASGWLRLAADLEHLSARWLRGIEGRMWVAPEGESRWSMSDKFADRATDCRARAARLTRGAL